MTFCLSYAHTDEQYCHHQIYMTADQYNSLSYAHTDEQYCHESNMTTDQYDSLSPTNRERVESRRSTTPQQSALLATRCRDRIQLKLRTARVIHSQYCTHAPRVFTSQIHPADSERIKHYFCKAVQHTDRGGGFLSSLSFFFLGGGGRGGDAKERKRFYINTSFTLQ